MDNPQNAISSSTESVSLFWNILEEGTDSIIPMYMKNIFKFSHLDQPIAFKSVTSDTIEELETFAREEMIHFLSEDDNKELFFGQYHKMPEKFRFLIGDKLLIKNLVTFVLSKPETYWKLKESSMKNVTHEKSLNSNVGKKSTLTKIPNYNINDERKQVMKLAKAIVMKKCPRKNLNDTKSLLEKIEIEVSVSEIYNDSALTDSFTYKARIKCPLCSAISKLKKCGSIGDKGCRWVLSNFDRHMKKHMDDQNQKMNDVRKSVTVADKLKQFANDNVSIQSSENHTILSEEKLLTAAVSPSTSQLSTSLLDESNVSQTKLDHLQSTQDQGEA